MCHRVRGHIDATTASRRLSLRRIPPPQPARRSAPRPRFRFTARCRGRDLGGDARTRGRGGAAHPGRQQQSRRHLARRSLLPGLPDRPQPLRQPRDAALCGEQPRRAELDASRPRWRWAPICASRGCCRWATGCSSTSRCWASSLWSFEPRGMMATSRAARRHLERGPPGLSPGFHPLADQADRWPPLPGRLRRRPPHLSARRRAPAGALADHPGRLAPGTGHPRPARGARRAAARRRTSRSWATAPSSRSSATRPATTAAGARRFAGPSRGEPGDWRCRNDPRKFDSPLLFRHGDAIYLVARRHLRGDGSLRPRLAATARRAADPGLPARLLALPQALRPLAGRSADAWP